MTSRFGGRPRLARRQLRDQRVVTFLTGEERRLLEKMAGKANVSLSRACHDLIARGLEQGEPLRRDMELTQRRDE